MENRLQKTSNDYHILIEPLDSLVQAFNGDTLIASSSSAKVMYETRLSPTIYFPKADIIADTSDNNKLRTFCPFKGTASYGNISIDGKAVENAYWYYGNPLADVSSIEGYVSFMPSAVTRFDLGSNILTPAHENNITGPTVDWILREAWRCSSPAELTKAMAKQLIEDGVAISRLSVLIWSLHPSIAGKNYIWSKDTDEIRELTPSYDIHKNPAFVNSPLRHVSNNLGGVRQRLNTEELEFDFPIMDDLKAEGATDYVAMPLQFSNGQTNVLTLTCDHPDGFTTANLGMIFELASVISRYYEVFTQTENSRVLLETYLGKRTGARVLGGEIRRGDGDEIDAAILFCDLRNSTSLEEKLGRLAYLELLNEFFEKTTDAVNENGGEVLKFIGDAVLAIFPAGSDKAAACQQASASASEIISLFSKAHSDEVQNEIDCSIGIAFGGVTYGNVGSQERLDFTVIGSAANIAARLADLGKREGQKIMMTEDVASHDEGNLQLGKFELRNVKNAIECYTPAP